MADEKVKRIASQMVLSISKLSVNAVSRSGCLQAAIRWRPEGRRYEHEMKPYEHEIVQYSNSEAMK